MNIGLYLGYKINTGTFYFIFLFQFELVSIFVLIGLSHEIVR